MTMTSVAVAPGSLGAPPAMLTPKRYHLQPGLQQNSASPTSAKNYDTLSKGKKSWSVRLGLSRQSQGSDESKGWGTISGGSALSRQMLYGDPWLYGTVRSSRGIHDPRAFLAAPPPPGAPVLIVCSCPEFLAGTTRKLGNCRKCGGHRLAGVPLGGTCRITPTSSRSRPSLAGVLRSSVDDPYDVMRRSRLVEPRFRARSISPHRQSNQRDSRSQSVVRTTKDRKTSTDAAVSRTEWFDTEITYDEKNARKSRTNFTPKPTSDDWLDETPTDQDSRNTPGRIVRIAKKPRNWQETNASSRTTENSRRNVDDDWKDVTTTNSSIVSGSTDSRKSILECNVNPYQLVKKQMRDEDDLSDDLSDNALEIDDKLTSSSLFDPTKVKSIERLPNRSAVAAIGGQRIRVFNEPREIFEDDETAVAQSVTRIPIPKISPKRPPRRIKESRTTLKSILKRGKPDGKRKNVLFNVNNVIFAPEKPPIMTIADRRSNRVATNVTQNSVNDDIEEPIVADQQIPERPKFITIPNIRDPKKSTRMQEPKIVAEVRNNATMDKTKMESSTGMKKPEVPTRNSSKKDNERKNVDLVVEEMRSLLEIGTTDISVDVPTMGADKIATTSFAWVEESSEDGNVRIGNVDGSVEIVRPEDETELEIEIEELEDRLPEIPLEDRELIVKSPDNNRRSCLARSQSDRTSIRPEITATSVRYTDTMRLSLRRRTPDAIEETHAKPSPIHDETMVVARPTTKIEKPPARDVTPEVAKTIDRQVDASPETPEIPKNHVELASQRRNFEISRNLENFRRMRPTSWSPPPGKPKHLSRDRVSDPGPFNTRENDENPSKSVNQHRRNSQEASSLNLWNSGSSAIGSSTIGSSTIGSSTIGSSSIGSSTIGSSAIGSSAIGSSTIGSSAIGSSAIGSSMIGSSTIGSSTIGSSSKIEILSARPETNVCKITVSPRSSPLVHRLQIGGTPASRGSRRTSILINGDLPNCLRDNNTSNDNKVTISVGGEDSVCNPTVISVNSEISTNITSPSENRTLVILDNYRSNIVLESPGRDEKINETTIGDATMEDDGNARRTKDGGSLVRLDKQGDGIGNAFLGFNEKRRSVRISSGSNLSSSSINDDDRNGFAKINQQKSRFRDIDGNSRWSTLSKEALISKLLEDSLRKARENGEILDESSGEAILRILKQSLLKSKDYESSESTIEPETTYSRSSSTNSDADFVSTNLFLEENPYEIIKEPIYEEIADEPPPLPLSPPPIEDYAKDRLYFGDDYKEAYYKKVNAGKFLRSYMSDDLYKKPDDDKMDDLNVDNYLSKSTDEFFKQATITDDGNLTSKFELLNFLMDTKERVVLPVEEDEEDDEVGDDDEEDNERDLEALYEQKETSMGDLSSKSSQISNVSDSSEECNIILTSSTEALKTRTVDIERTDSGVGSESSQASSSRGIPRRWRTGNVSSGPASLHGEIPQVISGDTKICEDCEQRLEPIITDSGAGVVYAPYVCRKCSKKRAERKEIITEIVETEQKYGRDLQIILEEFHRPMLRAGLLTQDQLAAIFLNVEELLEHNIALAEKLKDAVEFSQVSGDEDLVTVDVGKIFLESERMLHVFENYCTRQGGASLLLQNLEKEKELLRIFLKVSQMENTVLRRMNLNSFLMVPVQRVTKYPLLLARLLKATPSVRSDVHEARKRLEQAQANIELHLEHMNAEAKDVTSTKLWRRISIIQNGRRSNGEQDMVNIKLRKMAVEVLEWAHEEARFVLEGRLLVAQPTDNNWRRGRTVKLAPVTAMLVTNGKPSTEFLDSNDDSLFPKQIGIKDATLLLVKEKIGRYSLLREPLYLDKCIVCCETDLEDYFEIQELSSKETFIFKAEDGARTKRWCRTLQAHAQSLGAWRRRRGALPNIMICGVARS